MKISAATGTLKKRVQEDARLALQPHGNLFFILEF